MCRALPACPTPIIPEDGESSVRRYPRPQAQLPRRCDELQRVTERLATLATRFGPPYSWLPRADTPESHRLEGCVQKAGPGRVRGRSHHLQRPGDRGLLARTRRGAGRGLSTRPNCRGPRTFSAGCRFCGGQTSSSSLRKDEYREAASRGPVGHDYTGPTLDEAYDQCAAREIASACAAVTQWYLRRWNPALEICSSATWFGAIASRLDERRRSAQAENFR